MKTWHTDRTMNKVSITFYGGTNYTRSDTSKSVTSSVILLYLLIYSYIYLLISFFDYKKHE